jgi:predicted metal-binding membrane protein
MGSTGGRDIALGSAALAPHRAASALTLAGTFATAAACWVISIQQMNGMDMGVATTLGSFGFFIAIWAAMMAAMMLPGTVAVVLRRADRDARAVPLFLVTYIAVWTVVGALAYALYWPHGTTVAGIAVLAAGAYELTPLKRRSREHCRASLRSGFRFGLYCVGSSIGLMVMLLALGPMSIGWMAAIAAIAIAQKLLPPRAAIDLPVTAAIVALGILILVHPASVPGLMPTHSAAMSGAMGG